jgi:hypothetical protein
MLASTRPSSIGASAEEGQRARVSNSIRAFEDIEKNQSLEAGKEQIKGRKGVEKEAGWGGGTPLDALGQSRQNDKNTDLSRMPRRYRLYLPNLRWLCA